MKIERVKETPDEITLKIDASAQEMADAFNDGLAVFIEQFKLEELEGETPTEKLTKALGENASEAIASAVMSYLIPQALADQQIIPLSSSDVDYDAMPEAGKPFSFTMTVVPKPFFGLSDYSTFCVTVPAPPEVTEADIDEQILILARDFARQTQKAASDEELVVPAVTDTWVQQSLAPMGVNTVAELRETFRRNSEIALGERYQQVVLGAIMDVYFERFTGTITDKMVEAMTTDMVESFKAELAQDGTPYDEYLAANEITEQDVRDRLSEQAKIQLMQGFVLDAIYEHENLSVGVPDLMAMVHNIAPGDEEKTFDLMERTHRTFLLKEGAQRNKALAWIGENITVQVDE